MRRILYEQQLELFHELGQLSAEMAAFTSEQLIDEEGATELFQGLLQQRETIMKEIDRLTTQIQQLEKVEGNSLESIGHLQTALRAEAAKIEAHNQILEAVVKTALDELRERTKKVQEGRHSHRAYEARVPASEGSFIDKRR